MFLPIFHLSVVIINSFTLWYDQKYVDIILSEDIQRYNVPFKGRILFLTIWCLVLQTLYFMIAFLNDVFGTNAPVPRRTSLIRVTKDTLFSLAFPVALFVTIAFWGIYAYNKELILPDRVAKVFPLWMNHVMHTLISPFILVELFLGNKNYPSRKIGISMGIFFSLSYVFLLFYGSVRTGKWFYPVFEQMSWFVRISFVVSAIALGLSLYVVGEKLNSVGSKLKGKVKNR